VRSLYVNRAPALAAVDRLAMPTMLAWADGDQFIERPTIDALMARRPDWHLHIFPSGGHLPPMESPAHALTDVQPLVSAIRQDHQCPAGECPGCRWDRGV
jgi:pimeloyl-ACP methyl ester carboxylesterase